MSEDDLNLNEDEVFLMPTRQRRSTAGNKMRRLLDEELQEIQFRTEIPEEDEMDLLFKEEGNDEDFELESGSSENEGALGQNGEEKTGADDMDEMFSESEEDSGEQEDNEEGERNLRRQEKLESRKQKQKRKMSAMVKKKRPKMESEEQEQEARKKAQYEQIKAETLLTADRRTSQRSSVVANKMKVYEKLSRAEKKRKIIQDRIRRHKESQKEEILSQEDRIRIAMETEKVNILSLDKYKEQEISKKQSRIALQQRQKMKFKPGETILRNLSCTWEVTLLNEIEDIKRWEEQLRKRDKKKKRYSRKPHKKQNPDPEKEDKEVNAKKETNGEIASNDTKNNADDQLNIDNGTITANNTEARVCELVQVMQKQKDEPRDIKDEQGNRERSPSISSQSLDKSDDISMGEKGREKKEECFARTRDQKRMTVPDTENKNATQHFTDNGIIIPTSSGSNSATLSKQISFANEPQMNMMNSSSRPSSILSSDTKHEGRDTPGSIQDTRDEKEPIYQGPEQLVGKNFVTVYSFPTESYRNDINKELFGENWATGSSHRSSDVQTICKLTMPEGKIDILDNVSLVPNLSFLNKFPSFGEYDKKVVHDVDSTRNKELKIVVKTTPPTGVFLPNGFRKKCLVSSKECQYFDPKNGVPYSDVETYKTIQDLQDPIGNGSEEEPQPRYQWFGFGNGGIYLDVGQKAARGVPDGF